MQYTHLLVQFTNSGVVPDATAEIVGGGSAWEGNGKSNVGVTNRMNIQNIVLTYCDHYASSHITWKTRRQSYDTDGVGQATLWLSDCYSVVCYTSPNIHTALVSPSTVGYPVPSHSGS